MVNPKADLRIMAQGIDLETSALPFEESPLSSKTPFQILVLTMLSQRTTARNCQMATDRLFKVANTPKEVLAMSVEELERIIQPAGLADVKAKHIYQTCQILHDRYNDQVPRDARRLDDLPGVGPKTVAAVMTHAFGKQAICVDTHVHRVANRLGWCKTNTPDKTQAALMRVFEPEDWNLINPVLWWFGRRVCMASAPLCSKCPLSATCPSHPARSKHVDSHSGLDPQGDSGTRDPDTLCDRG